MRKLSVRESRLVAVLILVAAVALVALVVIGPIVDGFRDRAQKREQLGQQFLINERRIASLNVLQREAVRQDDAIRGMFLSAPDADEAGEALREQIEGVAQAAKVNIKATEAMQGAEDDWVRAALEVQVTDAQLIDLLARINTIKPGVVVDSVAVTAADALTNLESDTLDVRIEASAPFLRTR